MKGMKDVVEGVRERVTTDAVRVRTEAVQLFEHLGPPDFCVSSY